jgi:hypothetical protein
LKDRFTRSIGLLVIATERNLERQSKSSNVVAWLMGPNPPAGSTALTNGVL